MLVPVSLFSRNIVVLLFCAVFLFSGCGPKTKKYSKSYGNSVFGNEAGLQDLPSGSAPSGSSRDFSVNVGDRIFFDTDSSLIRSDAATILSNQARWLMRYRSYSVVVEGHADERGTREYNLALGARRAAAVRDFLVSNGIDSSRIKTISYGKERPLSVCDDISCWSQNRRAVTVVTSSAY